MRASTCPPNRYVHPPTVCGRPTLTHPITLQPHPEYDRPPAADLQPGTPENQISEETKSSDALEGEIAAAAPSSCAKTLVHAPSAIRTRPNPMRVQERVWLDILEINSAPLGMA